MRTLHLTNDQFDALYSYLEEVVETLEDYMITTKDDNGNEVLEDISKYEVYQIYQQLVSLKNDATVTNSDDNDYDTFSDKVITCKELEEQSLKYLDDDYASKVDRLVGNMAASNDKEFTHDSEGC